MTGKQMSRRQRKPSQRRRCLSDLRLLTLSLTLGLTFGVQGAWAQDTKREYVPEKIEAPQPTGASAQNKLGPAGPRINSVDLRRREAEANLARRDKSVEKKLQRIIRGTPNDDPKKPRYLDRLAQFYWQLAGDAQNRAYLEEERCYGSSQKTDADIERCDAVRMNVEREAEGYRVKAIQVYKYIVHDGAAA